MKTPASSPQLIVRGLSARATTGTIACGNLRFACALGKSGRRTAKREGDRATPIGCFAVREAFYRPDRLRRPRTRLPLSPLRGDEGWCDDPRDRNYNRRVRHPYRASAERLWRADHLYDVVIVLGHNDRPRVKGLGSAIFLHVAGMGLAPTAGCVAVRLPHLLRLLEQMSRKSRVRITA